MDSKRTVLSGRGVAVRGNDVDTDRIIPARFLKTVTFDGLGDHAFEDDRLALKKEGMLHPFDEPRFAGAEVLLVNQNFGCGSSREHAPQSLNRWGQGIKVIVGESFAEIFSGNCQALGVPCATVDTAAIDALMKFVETKPEQQLEVDIEKKLIQAADLRVPLQISDGPRQAFLNGTWDSTQTLLEGSDAVKKTAASIPYLNGFAS